MPNEDVFAPSGKLTFADFSRYQYFHYIRRLWPMMAFLLVCCGIGLAAVLSTGDPERIRNPGASYVMGLGLVVLQLAVPYVTARVQYAKIPWLLEPMRYHITEGSVRLEAPSFSGEMSWPILHSIYETRHLFLVYHTANAAWILPKRFFWGEDDTVERFRQFAAAHLKKRGLLRRPEILGALF